MADSFEKGSPRRGTEPAIRTSSIITGRRPKGQKKSGTLPGRVVLSLLWILTFNQAQLIEGVGHLSSRGSATGDRGLVRRTLVEETELADV